jgi:hypothetical protein
MISDEGDTSLNSGSQAQGDGDRSKLKQPSVFNEYKGDQKPEQAPLNPSLYGYDDYSKEFYGSTTSSFRNQTSSVLEDMKEGLALSMLVFLAADMRLLSATGSIGTKFESLAVESDFVIHNDKASCAVLNHAEEADTPQALPISIPTHVQQGLSPAHLMTIVLIEIRKTFKQQHRDQILNAKIKRHIGDAKNPEEAKAFTAFMLDKSKGKNKWEIDLSSLMKAHARMIGWDLNEKVPHIEARRSMLGFIGGNTDRRRASSVSMRQSIIAGLDYHRKELFDSTESKELNAMEEVTDALFNMAVATGTNGRAHNHRLRQSIKQTLSTSQPQQQTTNNTHFSLSSDDLLELMEKAVKSRKDDNLKFMANFFRSGTISQVMATSNIRVVWINDWFSQLDLMYAIAVDPLKKRVMVTFRCSITLNDWAKSLEYSHVHVENPVQDYYEGRKDLVCMHKGYYHYLFRVRKDTGTTKYEEIVNVAHRYGLERIGEGYTLSVTGHSLGAALSTIFAFHASTDERFTRNGPIKMMTFASPYVGESTGRHCYISLLLSWSVSRVPCACDDKLVH